jgi:hypothetical protein
MTGRILAVYGQGVSEECPEAFLAIAQPMMVNCKLATIFQIDHGEDRCLLMN